MGRIAWLMVVGALSAAGCLSSANGVAAAAPLPNDYFIDRDQDRRWDTGAWDQDFRNTHYLSTIKADRAWPQSKGEGVVIGLMDTGVDLNHPDLAGNIYRSPGESGGGKESDGIDNDGNGLVDDYRGWDFVGVADTDGKPGPDNEPQDLNGHGTAVAGIAAAVQGNGEGTSGVAPSAKILPTRITSGPGTNSIDLFAGIQAAGYLTARPDVDVIVVSGGIASATNPAAAGLCTILDQAVIKGKIVVVAAGNGAHNGHPARDVGTPATGGYAPAFCANAITATSATTDKRGARYLRERNRTLATRSPFADFGANVLLRAPAGDGEIVDPGSETGISGNPIPWSNNTILALRAANTNGVRRYIGDSGDPRLENGESGFQPNQYITDQVGVRQSNDPPGQPARYVRWRGTSFAAPQVAGTVALMLAADPEGVAKLPAVDGTSYPKLEAVKWALQRSGRRNPRDRALNARVLDAYKAIRMGRIAAR